MLAGKSLSPCLSRGWGFLLTPAYPAPLLATLIGAYRAVLREATLLQEIYVRPLSENLPRSQNHPGSSTTAFHAGTLVVGA